MPSTVPTPVAAALGLVPAVLGGVRRLPSRAVQLPVLALSSALSGAVAARRGTKGDRDRSRRPCRSRTLARSADPARLLRDHQPRRFLERLASNVGWGLVLPLNPDP